VLGALGRVAASGAAALRGAAPPRSSRRRRCQQVFAWRDIQMSAGRFGRHTRVPRGLFACRFAGAVQSPDAPCSLVKRRPGPIFSFHRYAHQFHRPRALRVTLRFGQPQTAQAKVRSDVTRFLAAHPDDLERGFETTFRPDIIPSALSGSTRGFLEEIRDLLGSG
jgi:hypothetical protein